MKRPGPALIPLVLAGLTAAAGVWDFQTADQARAVARLQAAPTPTPIVHVVRPTTASSGFQAGVSVVVYGNDPYFQHKAQALLDHLARLGVNSVSLVIPIFQDGWTASQVYTDPIRTPTDTNVAIFAAEAHRRGFVVMLRPLLDLVVPQTPNHWRGSIQPHSITTWQRTYSQLLLGYARLAQANRIESFDVGSELDTMEPYTTFWRGLITSVRRAYSGSVTYSANWAKSRYPAFGRFLDTIGIDAYYPLPAADRATVSDLISAWRKPLGRIAALASPFNKPVLLTELGTTSQQGSFRQPWVWDNGQPTDQSAQLRYYQAACPATAGTTSGIYWWMYTLDPLANPALDRSYDIYGKPAETAVSQCFTGSAP